MIFLPYYMYIHALYINNILHVLYFLPTTRFVYFLHTTLHMFFPSYKISLDPPPFTLLSNKGQSEIIKKNVFLTFQWLCLILYLYKKFLRLGQNLPLSYSLQIWETSSSFFYGNIKLFLTHQHRDKFIKYLSVVYMPCFFSQTVFFQKLSIYPVVIRQ
jgi:hypothetical protein